MVGYHDYDNTIPDMGAAFISVGPAFKKGALMEKFEMVDVYPLMTHLLEMKPKKNNGTLETFEEVLTQNFTTVTSEQSGHTAAMSVFKSRGGNSVSGMIYFSQKVNIPFKNGYISFSV